jgi:hypothetical protein
MGEPEPPPSLRAPTSGVLRPGRVIPTPSPEARMPRTRNATVFLSCLWRESTDRRTRMDALARVSIEPALDAPDGRRW